MISSGFFRGFLDIISVISLEFPLGISPGFTLGIPSEFCQGVLKGILPQFQRDSVTDLNVSRFDTLILALLRIQENT